MANDNLTSMLDQDLSDTFEDNIVMRYAFAQDGNDAYPQLAERIARKYVLARKAYLEAVASVVLFPNSLDYLD